MRVAGSLAFVDIAGFTRLTERLSRTGKAGAEEMSDILDATFTALLDEAMAEGADLVTWGGDAVVLLFQGAEHAVRAARAAHRMRSSLRTVGRITTSSGFVVLRMSVGVHSGEFDFFLVGDPAVHRELLLTGPGVSMTVSLEGAARAGQIGLSAETVALLPRRVLGAPLLDGRLLRTLPAASASPGGRSIDGGAHPPPVAPAEILPPPVLAHLRAGAGDAEHRAVAVAFVRWSGSDSLLLNEGPTAVGSALNQLVRTVQHACADHDVTFFESDVSHDGGKIMLVAGAPRSADHLEERLLRAARQILRGHGRPPHLAAPAAPAVRGRPGQRHEPDPLPAAGPLSPRPARARPAASGGGRPGGSLGLLRPGALHPRLQAEVRAASRGVPSGAGRPDFPLLRRRPVRPPSRALPPTAGAGPGDCRARDGAQVPRAAGPERRQPSGDGSATTGTRCT
jgi:class 3 adenylate cyclase